jgi:hypothetical protein
MAPSIAIHHPGKPSGKCDRALLEIFFDVSRAEFDALVEFHLDKSVGIATKMVRLMHAAYQRQPKTPS